MLQLTGVSGPVRGITWFVDVDPLILGRGLSCDIVINEPIVSRKHCKLFRHNGLLHLSNLGSDNSTLVNGMPVQNSSLEVGDEIAVGSAVFIIVRTVTGEGGRSSEQETSSPVTTIALNDSLYMGKELTRDLSLGRPRTVEDLAFLFSLGRNLCQATSVDELVASLTGAVEERFHDSTLWVGLSEGKKSRLRLVSNKGKNSPKVPLEQMRKALAERQASLVHAENHGLKERRGTASLLAPICNGGLEIGVLALELRRDQESDLMGDLELLLAVAHQSGSAFLSVKQIERLKLENESLWADLETSATFLGESKEARRIRDLANSIAGTQLSVVLLGESGTGKEVLARMVHRLSGRRDGPFITLNCAAIPQDLLESELFGYEKGAFSGASAQKLGWLERADGGTLFLDEIGDLSLESQAKILRAVELGEFQRLGGKTTLEVDLRVIVATNRDIHSMVVKGTFREDLLHRLSGIEITIAPLRERPSDIAELAHHFLKQGLVHSKRPIRGFSQEALERLARQQWRGNGRELKNCVERAIALGNDEVIQAEDISGWSREHLEEGDDGSFLPLREKEQQYVEEVLHACGGNVKQAAEILQVSRTTLYKRVTKRGIG